MIQRLTSKQIRQLRLRLGLTQREFALRVGVRSNTVWRWEAGQSQPTVYFDEKIRQVCE